MVFSRRQKITILALAVYWLLLFVLAHIPIPRLVRQAGVSDKCLHFLAYLILTFLFWFAIRPDEKVNWRGAVVWLVLCIVTIYGAVDELVQSYVGRTCDAADIAANTVGTLTGLFLLTVFSFWPAALVVTGIVIFGITNIARNNLAGILPLANTVFHLFAYVVFTSLWIYNMRPFVHRKAPDIRWLVFAIAMPAGFLLTVKLFSSILGRNFAGLDVIVSAGAIFAVVLTIYIKCLFRKIYKSESNRILDRG